MWTIYVEKNDNIIDELDDVELVNFFEEIKLQYSPDTLWVKYSCINTRFIYHIDQNQKGLVHLEKFLKLKTNINAMKKIANIHPRRDR